MSENQSLKLVSMADDNDPERWRNYCTAIARRILGDSRDAEECVNEVMLKAWEAIPAFKPENVKTFLGKLTRNTAINMRVRLTAQKRDVTKCTPLDEISELVSNSGDPEESFIRKELLSAVNDFLGTLPASSRDLFVLRYWYFESVPSLAEKFGISEKTVYVKLHRLREKLKKYLKEKGFLL